MIDINLFLQSLPDLLRGTVVTLQIAVLSCLIGITLGTLFGLLQARGGSVARSLITLYVTIVRGTPMLIQIFIVTYLLPEIGIKLPPFWAAIIAIGCNSAAYVSQIIRSGIASIATGQIEAAKVLGFSPLQTIYYIILPQAVTNVLPSIGNELVTLIKDSSLASVIGVVELTKEGSILRSRTYDVFTSFAAVGLIYLVITSLISYAINHLEKRMNIHAQH